jgi:Protein of unknown function (DUF3225)
MSNANMTSEVEAFLEEYRVAFDTFDVARISALYHTPCVTVRGDGSVHCLRTWEEIETFFHTVVETYRRDGCHSGKFYDLEVMPIGARSALATVRWEQFRADGSLLRQWRHSYNVIRINSKWQILTSTFHLS